MMSEQPHCDHVCAHVRLTFDNQKRTPPENRVSGALVTEAAPKRPSAAAAVTITFTPETEVSYAILTRAQETYIVASCY